MDNIKKNMEQRIVQLEHIIKEARKELAFAPSGMLRVSVSDERIQCYLRQSPEEHCGKYIRKRDWALAESLAQKEYNQLVLEAAQKERSVLMKMLELWPECLPEQVYSEMIPSKKMFITPAYLTNEEFAEQWAKMPYTGKPIREDAPKLFTNKGELVRSKSEILVGNALDNRGIPYRYECPLKMEDGAVWYPDFTALNVRLRKVYYWEHFGMMDDEEYCQQAIGKIARYQANGIFPGDSLIITFETGRQPLDPRLVEALIDQYLV